MLHQIGSTEILILLGVVVLLFGGKKLPELARGSGRALRIFKTEVSAIDEDVRDVPSRTGESAVVTDDTTVDQPPSSPGGTHD